MIGDRSILFVANDARMVVRRHTEHAPTCLEHVTLSGNISLRDPGTFADDVAAFRIHCGLEALQFSVNEPNGTANGSCNVRGDVSTIP